MIKYKIVFTDNIIVGEIYEFREGEIEMKKKKVIYLEDLIKSINDLPNAPNGFSASYDKARILNMVEDIPTHYETTKKQ